MHGHNVRTTMVFQKYGNPRSALTSLFVQCEVTRSEEFLRKIVQSTTGLEDVAAQAREDTGAKLGEGKQPLSTFVAVYRALCNWLLESEESDALFGRCFLTMTWNLMSRSKNTVHVRREHMNWVSDALAIKFAHSKTDAGGLDDGYVRHVYANSFEPYVCAVLSLGHFLDANPGDETGPLWRDLIKSRLR